MPTWSPGIVSAYAMLAFLLLATALAQVAFKHFHHTGRRASLVLAIALFVVSPPITILAARRLGIGEIYVLMSLSYGLVAFMGWKLFNERIARAQLQGLALIMLGCIVYTF
jgi:multidrug transporter EmrE-like cation transporter